MVTDGGTLGRMLNAVYYIIIFLMKKYYTISLTLRAVETHFKKPRFFRFF